MRRLIGIVLLVLWLLGSGVIWAIEARQVGVPSTPAVPLNQSQVVLVLYHLENLLGTLVAAYLSVAAAGVIGGAWLLIDGLVRRVRLVASTGGVVIAIEAVLALFTWLRFFGFQSPQAETIRSSSIYNAADASSAVAQLLFVAVVVLALALGAILVANPAGAGARGTAREAAQQPEPEAEQAVPGTEEAAERPTESEPVAEPAPHADEQTAEGGQSAAEEPQTEAAPEETTSSPDTESADDGSHPPRA